MQIEHILANVENYQMVLPEFQREYVWSKEDAKQLMISLYKRYPTGSLLIWEASPENIPEIKNNAIKPKHIGLTNVILDGQQRITTLYLLIKGQIPPYYKENDLMSDPRELFFCLNTGEFKYHKASEMENNPLWQKVTDCFNFDSKGNCVIDPIDISDQYLSLHSENTGKDLRNIVNKNLNALQNIRFIDYPVLSISSEALVDEAIDVFDRINSQGTKLTDAELVLTHITGKWPHARRELKKKIEEYQKIFFDFDLDFLTRCMVVALTDSALYQKNAKLNYDHFIKDNYITAWKNVSKALDYIIPVLKNDAYLHSSNDMISPNVLVPMVAYLLKNDMRMSEPVRYGFVYWIHLASIWSRYSGQTDTRLDKDVYLAISSENPIQKLIDEIRDQRGRIDVKSSDLEGKIAGHPLYRTLYAVTKFNRARDWSDGGPITDRIGDYYSIQSHHIFPQSLLYDSQYDWENQNHKKMVNEIANRAFITRDANFKIGNKNPEKYLAEIELKYPGSLDKQLIPKNPEFWKLKNYELFLTERRKLIAEAINAFLGNYKKLWENQSIEKTSWKDLIEQGENDFIEFKQSLRWDNENKSDYKISEYVAMKVINSFLNSSGGKLFVGVSDDKRVVGIEPDYKTFDPKSMKQDSDGFRLHLDNLIKNYLGDVYHAYITVIIDKIDKKEVCIIDVKPSDNPVYLQSKDSNGQKKEEFYIRRSASSIALGRKESDDYRKMHWT